MSILISNILLMNNIFLLITNKQRESVVYPVKQVTYPM